MQYKLAMTVSLAIVEGQAVVLDGQNNRYIGFNGVGTKILESISLGLPFDDIIDRLASDYDCVRDRLANDTSTFISELIQLGVIVDG